ncbi:MAG TPA: hypothetical protein VFT34_17960 [Verrucomicrobiae bacterium]|nr:hypothetical protein [Verrucomicrobiae bacterium]
MFESIRTLFRKWTPWEERLLTALSERLGRKHCDIFRQQIDAVNKVQRIVGWAEIDLYVIRGGRVCWDDVPKWFDDREFTLARASTIVDERRIQSELSCVGGHFFCIESDAPIKPLAFRSDIRLEIFDVDKRFA